MLTGYQIVIRYIKKGTGKLRNETERNETKRNETKRNELVSCFSNYYRDITILRNETIPFRFVPFRF
jgi:hypothetical protein